MNILIKNMSNTYNYGSMMMGENLITYLLKYSQIKLDFYIDATTNNHTKRLKQATGYNNIYLDDVFNYTINTKKIPFIRYVERKIKEFFSIKKCKKKYDAVFILGGDDFSELYYDIPKESKHILNSLSYLEKINRNTKLFMLGQTIGPYTGERLKKAKRTFNKIELYTRDDINNNYMKQKMQCNAMKMRDLAFLELNLQKEYENNHNIIIKDYGLKDNKYITIVGTGLMHHYSNNINDVAQKTIELLKKIYMKNKDLQLVWLTHVYGNTKSDSRMIKLMKEIDKEFVDEITIIDEEMLPAKARVILGHAHFNISFRMHAAVSSFQMGKPCICLSYSPKYNGVIGDGLKMKELVIESRNSNYWKVDNKYLNQQISLKIDFINENYDKLIQQIIESVEECKRINIIVLSRIIKKLVK